MKTTITKTRTLEIEPENIGEIIFIEDVLDLKIDQDTIILKRVNAMNLDSLAYLETVKEKP